MNIQYTPQINEARNRYLSISKSAKEEKAAAREVWSNLSIEEVDQAVTLEEVIVAFRAAPWGTPAKRYALEKWAELCTTIEELGKAYEVSSSRFDRRDNPVLDKWNAISCIEAHTAATPEEAELAYFSSPWIISLRGDPDSARVRAFKKWMSLCTSPDEVMAIEGEIQARHHPRLRKLYQDRYEVLFQIKHGRKPEY